MSGAARGPLPWGAGVQTRATSPTTPSPPRCAPEAGGAPSMIIINA